MAKFLGDPRLPKYKRVGGPPGWRGWILDADLPTREPRLCSMIGKIWEGPTMSTDGGKRVHVLNPAKIPGYSRRCFELRTKNEDWGVYSYKSPIEYLKSFGAAHHLVTGRVDVLGHTIEHTRGYRSQQVIIRELWYRGNYHYQETLEQIYECPVHHVSSSVEMKEVLEAEESKWTAEQELRRKHERDWRTTEGMGIHPRARVAGEATENRDGAEERDCSESV